MSIKKTFLLAAILLTCVVLSALLPPVSTAKVNAESVTAASPGAQSGAPKITKAVLVKKTLTIEGENFAAGAKLLVNGEIVKKSFNDELTPATKMIVNKANRRLPFEEVVSLQVQNPDGQISGLFGFFTGLNITYQSTQLSINVHLQVGQKFLINFQDPVIIWSSHDSPLDASGVIGFLENPSIIPSAQGLYIANKSGYAPFVMNANPLNGTPPFRWHVNLYVDN